jgi:hypothetical protein
MIATQLWQRNKQNERSSPVEGLNNNGNTITGAV